jgi:hypothetical protein
MAGETRVAVEGGKFTVVLCDDGSNYALRYGEHWAPHANGVGNLAASLAYELDEARQEIATLRKRRDELLDANNRELDRRRAIANAAERLREAQRAYMAVRNSSLSEVPFQERERLGQAVATQAAALDLILTDYNRRDDLRDAGRALYLAGRWELCRKVGSTIRLSDQAQAHLWERFRDALGLAPGTATAAGIGSATNLCPYCADKPDCECEPPLPFIDRPGVEL